MYICKHPRLPNRHFKVCFRPFNRSGTSDPPIRWMSLLAWQCVWRLTKRVNACAVSTSINARRYHLVTKRWCFLAAAVLPFDFSPHSRPILTTHHTQRSNSKWNWHFGRLRHELLFPCWFMSIYCCRSNIEFWSFLMSACRSSHDIS